MEGKASADAQDAFNAPWYLACPCLDSLLLRLGRGVLRFGTDWPLVVLGPEKIGVTVTASRWISILFWLGHTF